MKTFAWNKLPVNKIFGKNNIWTKMAKTFEKEKSAPIGRTMMSMSGSLYLNSMIEASIFQKYAAPNLSAMRCS